MFIFSQVYLKVTNLCNMGCKHCYIPEKIRKEKTYLDENKLKIIFENLKPFSNNFTSFSIHGGEPLLLDIDYYQNFLKIFKNYFPNNYIDIQSSLYPFFGLIDNNKKKIDDYIILFKKYNVILSVSLDFEGIRIYKNSYEKYIEYFLKTVTYLNENNIYPVLIITVTKYMKGKEEKIYKWLYKNKEKFSRIIMEDYTDINEKILKIKNSEIAEIYINFYKLDKKNKFYLFPYFKTLTNNIKNKNKLPGRFNVLCQKVNLVIEPDGKLTNCPDKAGKEYYGNIFNKNWQQEYIKNINYLKSVVINNKKLNICENCEYNNICNGGCPLKKEKIFNENILDKKECSAFYPFLKYIDTTLKG